MRSLFVGLPLGALACWLFLAAGVPAQQVTVSTPYHSISEGFFENIGTSWGLSGPNWFFSFGGSPTQAAPQFGGFDPSAGANFGFSRRSGGINGWFNGNWSQGCRRSFVSQTPSITLTNGYPGYVADASVTPFVVSYVPVVGSYPRVGPPGPVPPAMVPSPGASGVGHDAVLNALQGVRADAAERERMQNASPAEAEAARMALGKRGQDSFPGKGPSTEGRLVREKSPDPFFPIRSSSAGRPAPSVAEARRLHAAEQAAENEAALKYVELARNAEAAGKPNVAKVYYQNAARGASGALREEILSRIQGLDSQTESR